MCHRSNTESLRWRVRPVDTNGFASYGDALRGYRRRPRAGNTVRLADRSQALWRAGDPHGTNRAEIERGALQQRHESQVLAHGAIVRVIVLVLLRWSTAFPRNFVIMLVIVPVSMRLAIMMMLTRVSVCSMLRLGHVPMRRRKHAHIPRIHEEQDDTGERVKAAHHGGAKVRANRRI